MISHNALLNGGKPSEMKAEARDEQGRVTGHRNRRDGRDIVVTKVG